MYPFKDQKTIANEYLIEPKYKLKNTAVFNMKRSSICLERSPFSGLNIPTKLSYAAKQFFQVLFDQLEDGIGLNSKMILDFIGYGEFNQTQAVANTDPCSEPDFKKIKLGSYKSMTSHLQDDANFEFLEIKLVNDPIKLTNERSAMEILAFFGAIGGMQRFVGKMFGFAGNYFSAKFFGAKLANDLYIMKKKKKFKQDRNIDTPPHS